MCKACGRFSFLIQKVPCRLDNPMMKPKPNNGNPKLARKSTKSRDRVLRDGTIITQVQYESADLELHAFFRFNRLRYDRCKMATGVLPIPLEIVLKPQPATTNSLLELCALSRANDDLKNNGLLPLNPKLDLKPKEYFYALQSRDFLLRIRFDRHKAVLLESLNCLDKRKSGWTLLGIRLKKYLVKLMVECFSQNESNEVNKSEIILSSHLTLLLARKNLLQRGNRVSAANSRSSKERSDAAKRGWKSRRSTSTHCP
jgi:hypothetical protein